MRSWPGVRRSGRGLDVDRSGSFIPSARVQWPCVVLLGGVARSRDAGGAAVDANACPGDFDSGISTRGIADLAAVTGLECST